MITSIRVKVTTDPQEAHAVQLQCGGVRYSWSFNEFGVYLGFYTMAELTSDQPLTVFAGTTCRAHEEFWSEIAPSEPMKQLKGGRWSYYKSSTSKAAAIEVPLLRLLHHFLRATITQRGNSGGVCTARDLFLLYSVHIKERVHLAPLVAKLLAAQRSRSAETTSKLYGGSYVTRLVKNLRCQSAFGTLSAVPRVSPHRLTSSLLRAAGILDFFADRCPAGREREPVMEEGPSQGRQPPPPVALTDDLGAQVANLAGRVDSLQVSMAEMYAYQQYAFQEQQRFYAFTHPEFPPSIPFQYPPPSPPHDMDDQ